MEIDRRGAGFVSRSHDVEVEHISEDLRATMRGLHRMRAELQRLGTWSHVEAACVELSRARAQLKLKSKGV